MNTYGLHDTHPDIKSLQRLLNETFNLNLKIDGNIGKVTQSAIEQFQTKYRFQETDEFGVCYGPLTQNHAIPLINQRYLQEAEFIDAATVLNVDVAVIKAFATVEAKEFGFLDNGFPVILFERHKFYFYIKNHYGIELADNYAAKYPNICNSVAGGYLGGDKEIERYNFALSLDSIGAKSSCSWGMFQIMAFNYSICGYSSVDSFVDDMMKSEDNHLRAFVQFIKANNALHKALINKEWTTLAKLYNGPAYERNGYHEKMAEAYLKFK